MFYDFFIYIYIPKVISVNKILAAYKSKANAGKLFFTSTGPPDDFGFFSVCILTISVLLSIWLLLLYFNHPSAACQ